MESEKISHEINNVASIIIPSISIIKKRSDDIVISQVLDNLAVQVKKLNALSKTINAWQCKNQVE